MKDILVVAGKEIREIVGAGGGRRGLVRELLFVGIFGLFFPLSQAEAWRVGGVPAVFAVMIPLFLVGPHVADSFAGERERQTLETLLATRLPDRSIYLGKIFAVCGYAWVVTLLILLASLVALNLSGAGEPELGWDTGLFVYPAFVWVAWAVGSIGSGLLLASIGTFVSLRSKTVRAAHQAMMIPLFVLIFGGSFGIPVLFRMLAPETRKAVLDRLDTLSAVSVVLAAVGVLLLFDVGLLALGLRRFRRDRLIAD
ncbi:MAG: ABC transporter permease [Gemmatimonadota bacterium]